ncbi:MAG: bifunctional glutamate N-acetyltransferase/amino-acid acetyltransferase ArgJ [Desulfobacteraceae bacterium]|jgi:glutamate N-acetyltransferase/amino-acid N-acetyltransferase|uniref:Arginine biosynthesis bifunctional protein ArgJ n=1 Tax=Candidatus Desulfacyla euxinica TaxID=2841693 RepID=A0A8J6T673_9DELT|nr:bifunctional glutamate N-acetyltransferase/amino-acid acetyltransferase ArgJ [Candidatus Desulfacyla euxinica]MBL6978397.1 bifunctional glutamate N-acetyltransferase/amino-acid acetyltransferase ArgJ [Desulfobacteraceae bacterium]MBL7216761.1 bifunctional glutamate N-acetyltransferase/amino-acid acetyltransferase ArgJ [Desulfobacteraceae bacterium]MBW1869000.1 bifunctional glutamate N-acetyltransferase/amino-acid acetyltransferase ArgJ [Deltaproteobacteria bacterium]
MTNDYTVQGFKAGAVVAGLKKNGALDLALIVSDRKAAVAGVFTTNKVRAAPVILSEKHVENGKARAIIANAGNANACTGDPGLNDARRTADLVSRELGINPEDVLVASTGVIGEYLDMDLIAGAIPGLTKALTPDAVPLAAQAIMTTDSFPKISSFVGRAGEHAYRIIGIAKGAGMIMPDMATMLCFILSDININSDDLKRALLSSVETTFNRISVDGDTSTNDTVLAMANGLAGNKDLHGEDYDIFAEGLRNVMWDLARMIVRDGEGATKLVSVEVKNAFSPSDALMAVKTVANSSLVKTALYGQDPNWGRIMAALGRAEIEMREDRVDIWIGDAQIVAGGLGMGAEAEKLAAEIMTLKEFSLTVDLHQGEYHERMFTCDLTHEYVTINADYRT